MRAHEEATMVAIDPSLAAPGYAVIDLAGAEPRLLAAGVFETKPDKRAKRKTEDDARRELYVRRGLASVLRIHRPKIVAAELSFGSRNIKAALAMRSARVIVSCVVDEYFEGASPVWVTAPEAGIALGITATQRKTKGEAKKTSAEKDADRNARKSAIARAVVERLTPGAWVRALGLEIGDDEELFAARWEGAFDAAAVGLAAWERPEVASVRAMARAA